jgi:multiple sugar transport system ATP-binding protein
MADLVLSGVKKAFGALEVVHGIDLTVADGEFVVLVGPSGCGKSTILRMIAGLEDVSAGTIAIGGRPVNDLGAKDRNLAMVFQDYALYPHMTVAENIGFGLRLKRVPRAERERRVREVAELLHIEPYLSRKPRALSGGQRQRVAMGRALARSADLFLFDEPLSNLDAKLRIEVRTQIRLLHQRLGMTSVFVTHDQTEAMTIADRIVCLDAGRIAQAGTPDQLYRTPANVFVAGFIGSPPINLLDAVAEDGRLRLADGQTLPLPERAAAMSGGRRVTVGLRPEDLTDRSRLSPDAAAEPLAITLLVRETLGSDTLLVGTLGAAEVTARCAPDVRADPGAAIFLLADTRRLHLFDPATGVRL